MNKIILIALLFNIAPIEQNCTVGVDYIGRQFTICNKPLINNSKRSYEYGR